MNNALVDVLRAALAGAEPISMGCETLEAYSRPDAVTVGLVFESAAEAAAFVEDLSQRADAARDELAPRHSYLHPAPSRVQ